ncbi:MAG TPA: sigma-70 family RNA polymerase sigma factor [Candidatus Angelobacter sp.]|nr:sigma-70 family RNA polymerase sigma factor [Candidatus Angelobacter sp.]
MLLPHRELAVAMVLRSTRNLAEAEDCVHDAMLRLVRRDDLDPARVRALLIRAALHVAIDHHRAAAREQSAVVRLGGGLEADGVSPEQVLEQRVEVARMLAAIDSLPRRERQVMRLRLAGLSVAEAAARLGISVKSVEGAYTRARARVRYLLGAGFAWVADRLRRMAAPEREAVVTTVAALLLVGPSWARADCGGLPLPGGGSSPPGLQARGMAVAGDSGHRDGSAPTSGGGGDTPDAGQGEPAHPPRYPPFHPRWGLHQPAPNPTISVPIGVTLPTPDPSAYPGALYAAPKALRNCLNSTARNPSVSC